MENDLRWKTPFNGRQPSVEDDLRWKTTFGGRQLLVEDDLCMLTPPLCVIFFLSLIVWISRSLLHVLLTSLTNGDKVVLDKLDSCVTATKEDVDDSEFAIVVDHNCLVNNNPKNMVLIKDLLYLPKGISTKVLGHPVITTFIEKKWLQTRWSYMISFTIYLLFVLLFSSFLWLMYERYEENEIIRIPVKRPRSCDPLHPVAVPDRNNIIDLRMNHYDMETIDITRPGPNTRETQFKDGNKDVFDLHLEVIKIWKNQTNKSRVKKKFQLFSGCCSDELLKDSELCIVEILLLVSIILLVIQEFWQCLALGCYYFRELESWFELLILSLAISTLCLKTELESLQIVSAVGICLAWIELIFLFGRYPFLGELGKHKILK